MGACLSTSADQTESDCTVQSPVKFDKKQKALQELIVMERGKVHRRVTDLYETALSNPLSMTVINLNFIRLNSADCQHLTMLFPLCENITTVKLWKCKIQGKGVEFLANALSGLPQLQVLVLDDNALGIPGAKHLSACIPECSQLRQLCCRSNDLQCEGVSLLTETMGYLKHLTELALDDNDMTSYGLEHLLDSLDLSKLERLGLSYDRITDCGVQRLIQCAGMMENLDTLDLKGNLVSVVTVKMLQQAFPNAKIESTTMKASLTLY